MHVQFSETLLGEVLQRLGFTHALSVLIEVAGLAQDRRGSRQSAECKHKDRL